MLKDTFNVPLQEGDYIVTAFEWRPIVAKIVRIVNDNYFHVIEYLPGRDKAAPSCRRIGRKSMRIMPNSIQSLILQKIDQAAAEWHKSQS